MPKNVDVPGHKRAKGEIVKYLRIIGSMSKTCYTMTFRDTSSVKITEI